MVDYQFHNMNRGLERVDTENNQALQNTSFPKETEQQKQKAHDEVLTSLLKQLPVSQYDFSHPTLTLVSFQTFMFSTPRTSFSCCLGFSKAVAYIHLF